MQAKKYSPNKVLDLIGTLFSARQEAHQFHLKSKSYSEHIALDEFYNGILSLIDNFVEVYQGKYGIIKSFPKLEIKNNSPIQCLEELAKKLSDCHSFLGEDNTHLENILDEMSALTFKTLYKLKNLK